MISRIRRPSSIRDRLSASAARAAFLVVAPTLGLALVFHAVTQREHRLREVQELAAGLADQLGSARNIDDPSRAESAFQALRNHPFVASAALYTRSGDLVAFATPRAFPS